MDDKAETDPREVQAAKYNLSYIGMDGNIACLGELCVSWCYVMTKLSVHQLRMFTVVNVNNQCPLHRKIIVTSYDCCDKFDSS